jgi:hypothetical protein
MEVVPVTVGTCGRCNGPVVVPDIWHGIHPPTPQCAHCHAIPIMAHGRVLPMREPQAGSWRHTQTTERPVTFTLEQVDPNRKGGSW